MPAPLFAIPPAASVARFIIPLILSLWGGKKASDPESGKGMQTLGMLAHLFGGIGAGSQLAKGIKPIVSELVKKKGLGPFGMAAKGVKPTKGTPARRALNMMKGSAPGMAGMGAMFAPFLVPEMIRVAQEPLYDVNELMQQMPELGMGGQSPDMALLAQLMGGGQGELRDQNIDLFNMLTGRDLVA